MLILFAFLLMLGVAFAIVAVVFAFEPSTRKSALFCLLASVVMIGVGGTVLYLFAPRPQPCTVALNSPIVWRSFVSGKNPVYLTYFATVDHQFCRVESQRLYDMDLGYRTSQPYQGIVISRP